MDLSPAKCEILEALLLHDKPVKAAQLAKDMGKEFPAVQMHLIGLAKMGYADSPQKGQYILSTNGKKILDLPEITKEKAQKILAKTPPDKAFHFYAAVGKPLNQSAHSLQEFSDKIATVKVETIEFHMNRGDFKAWFNALGDAELSKKTALLKEKKLAGEELRSKLRDIVETRCKALSQS
jgi:hypothetical protein